MHPPSGSGRRQQPQPSQGSAQNPVGRGLPTSRRKKTQNPTDTLAAGPASNSASGSPTRTRVRTPGQRSSASNASAKFADKDTTDSPLPDAPDAQLTILLQTLTNKSLPAVSHWSSQICTGSCPVNASNA